MNRQERIKKLLPYLSKEDQEEIDRLITEGWPIWQPLPGPQTLAFESMADIVGYGGAAGGGKALSLDTPLPTPAGWTTMGEVNAGDELLDNLGNACQVVAVSPVMENHNCYEVSFSDGSTIIADEGHRWLTSTLTERTRALKCTPEYRTARRRVRTTRGTGKRPDLVRRNKEGKSKNLPTSGIRTTEEIAETLLVRGRVNHSVDVCRPLVLPEADLLIPPYVLGAWLGGGTSAAGAISGIDEQVFSQVANCGYVISPRSDPMTPGILGLQKQLRQLSLLNNKHIPPVYLRSSVDQRVSLLQGVMDTDGHANDRGQCEICLTRKPLIDNVLELVLSLGIKANIVESHASLNGRVISPKYTIKFLTEIPAFRLARKLIRQKRAGFRGTHSKRYITGVAPVSSVPVKCVAVDSVDRLYLAGRQMIPTHNTDLMLGKALTQHTRAIIYRREGTQLYGITDRMEEIIGDRNGFNGQKNVWRHGDRIVEFGGVQHEADKKKYQGRPHSLKCFDETTEFLESQVRFLMGWLRSADEDEPKQVIMAFNPPTTEEGRWIIKFFAPWLDKKHPNPAEPGELRWFTTIDGEDQEVKGSGIIKIKNKDGTMEEVEAVSRTFIPAKVDDNPYYMRSGYKRILQAMPEPLRSQMLNGDFTAGVEDDPWQVIPTLWVEVAMARWKPEPPGAMDALGMDVARGGKDKTILAPRHGTWFGELTVYDGLETPNGQIAAGYAISMVRNKAPIHVDVIGVGASVYDHLAGMNVQVIGVNGANSSEKYDKTGNMRFVNKRAEVYWGLRELLDPAENNGAALPPDDELKSDLCSLRWRLTPRGILIESKEDIIKRLGRSTDRGDGIAYASIVTPKRAAYQNRQQFAETGVNI